MNRLEEAEISKVILCTYHEKLLDRVESDILIVGAGPSGLVAAYQLAKQGRKVTVLEKRLAPGGGIWGGGMGQNQAVVEENVLPLLEELGIGYEPRRKDMYAVDTVHLAAGLCYHATKAGAVILNLMTVEDVCVRKQRVSGVVVNRTMIAGTLPVDPIMLIGKAVVDATGHEAMVVETLRKRGMLADSPALDQLCEGPMDADSGEQFVVEHAQEIFPGLWISGMSVCAVLGGPRMGPIFGGMLLSGQRIAQLIQEAID